MHDEENKVINKTEGVTPPGATLSNPAHTKWKSFLVPLPNSLCSLVLGYFVLLPRRMTFSVFVYITPFLDPRFIESRTKNITAIYSL